MWSIFFYLGECDVITPKYGKTAWIFGIIGVMAKTLHEYWSGHPCLVGVAGPNVCSWGVDN